MTEHPLIWVIGCFAIGVAVVAMSVGFGAKTGGDLLYDVGIGVLIATAFGGVISYAVQRQERTQREHAEREERIRRDSAEAIRKSEERLAKTTAEMEAMLSAFKTEDTLDALDDSLNALHQDVRLIRERVDPSYEHPERAALDAIFDETLRKRKQESERAAKAADTPDRESETDS